MIMKDRFSKIKILVLLLIGVMAVSVYGQEGDKPVADEMISSDGITWIPRINYSLLDLTISRPDGTLYSKTFDAGSSPYVDISDVLGKGYLNGSYIYELRAMVEAKKKERSDEEFEARYSPEPIVQTGAFSVLDGRIMIPEEKEPGSGRSTSLSSLSGSQDGLSRAQDFVISDDLIVDGSACIGFDCVNGEVFGFDTLRLKENNLRIKFDDTSTAGAFPRNDWQITANDSANGGASKFSIEDITGARVPFTIEAGARTNSLYVDDGGRLGLRTSTPSVELHIVDGDTPSVRLQQDGSSGFAPQTWDIAGNETNFFIRDVTGGSQLPFRIRPGAPTSAIDIAASGNIGFRTSSPSYPLHLKTASGTNAELVTEQTGAASCYMSGGANYGFFGTKTNHPLRLSVQGSYVMEVNATGNLIYMKDGGSYNGTWNNGSSREIKENIEDLTLDEAEHALEGLNPVKYNYKATKDEPRVGFIAEDVPELVAMKDRKNLSSMDIVAVLAKVLKEQQKTIAELKEKVAQLEKK